MKRFIVVGLAAIGAVLVWRKTKADTAEQDLWAEATDSVND
jgi:hypothetical protein